MIDMHKLLLFACLLGFSLPSLSAQGRFFTKKGSITFDADGPMIDIEKIHATSTGASCVVDAASGQMEWAVPVKSFKFKNALMEEHFNENYLESEKYPKATFKGSIANPEQVKWTEDGNYPVKVTGKMTLHGVTRDVQANGNILVKDKEIRASSKIEIGLADYKIKIPSVVGLKISESAQVAISATLEPLTSN